MSILDFVSQDERLQAGGELMIIEPETNLAQTKTEQELDDEISAEWQRDRATGISIYSDFDSFCEFQIKHYNNLVLDKVKQLKEFGYWGDEEWVRFLDEDGRGFKAELTEELYQRILVAIKKASPAKREAAKEASIRGLWFGDKAINWSSPSVIARAAQYAGIDVRIIIAELARGSLAESDGAGSADDGIIYILRHRRNPIVKVGKTKSLSASRAANYTVNHDDPDGWVVYHEVNTRNVSGVEARVHKSLQKYRAAYGYNAKEVFAVSVSIAMKAVYAEIEL